jgi:hypothetical protein
MFTSKLAIGIGAAVAVVLGLFLFKRKAVVAPVPPVLPGKDTVVPATTPPASTPPAGSATTSPVTTVPLTGAPLNDAERDARYAMPKVFLGFTTPEPSASFYAAYKQDLKDAPIFGDKHGVRDATAKASADWGKNEDPKPVPNPVTDLSKGPGGEPELVTFTEAKELYATAYLGAYRTTYDSIWKATTAPVKVSGALLSIGYEPRTGALLKVAGHTVVSLREPINIRQV